VAGLRKTAPTWLANACAIGSQSVHRRPMHPRKLETRILQAVNLANRDFNLISHGDRILIAMSGGKDSYGMMWALQKIRASAVYDFELVAYHLDQGQPGHNPEPIETYMKGLGLPYEIEYQDTYTRVVEMTEPGKVYCALCSRFRRAIVYKAATRHGCNKVALGHHRDDLLETLMLNLFFSGQLKSMPPKLRSDDGTQILLRPLVYVPETELAMLSENMKFPILPCRLCGSQDSERKAVKQLLEELTVRYPRMRTSMLAAMGNIRKTHLLDASVNPLYAAQVPQQILESLPVDTDDDDVCATTTSAAPSDGLVQIGASLLGAD
jgi:tRNA 2-thiocytidine biosynthesis protein TtcA